MPAVKVTCWVTAVPPVGVTVSVCTPGAANRMTTPCASAVAWVRAPVMGLVIVAVLPGAIAVDVPPVGVMLAAYRAASVGATTTVLKVVVPVWPDVSATLAVSECRPVVVNGRGNAAVRYVAFARGPVVELTNVSGWVKAGTSVEVSTTLVGLIGMTWVVLLPLLMAAPKMTLVPGATAAPMPPLT